MSKWISVNDRLPENDDRVLIFPYVDLGCDRIWGLYLPWADQWIALDYEPNQGQSDIVITPTHWQPMGEPPKE